MGDEFRPLINLSCHKIFVFIIIAITFDDIRTSKNHSTVKNFVISCYWFIIGPPLVHNWAIFGTLRKNNKPVYGVLFVKKSLMMYVSCYTSYPNMYENKVTTE